MVVIKSRNHSNFVLKLISLILNGSSGVLVFEMKIFLNYHIIIFFLNQNINFTFSTSSSITKSCFSLMKSLRKLCISSSIFNCLKAIDSFSDSFNLSVPIKSRLIFLIIFLFHKNLN
jgi:hypothetical protein